MGNVYSAAPRSPPAAPPATKAPNTLAMKRELDALAIAAHHLIPSATTAHNDTPSTAPLTQTSPVAPRRRRSRAGRRLSQPREWWKTGPSSTFQHKYEGGKKRKITTNDEDEDAELARLEHSPVTTEFGRVGSDKEASHTPAGIPQGMQDVDDQSVAIKKKISVRNGHDSSPARKKSAKKRKRAAAAVALEDVATESLQVEGKEETKRDGGDGGNKKDEGEPLPEAASMALSPVSIVARKDGAKAAGVKKGKRRLFSKASAMQGRLPKRRKQGDTDAESDAISVSRKDSPPMKREVIEKLDADEGVSITTGSQGLHRGNRMAVFDLA